ncbi:MAG TPA: hypothetical protein VLT81_07315 [Chondromyces sp.]|nr:hypothetical protein [Chondromyces sp.]
MKRFLTIAVVGVMALGLSSVAYANYCSFDAVPSATLLFPFVAYDYEGGFDGQTTQLAITNVSAEAQIVHITVWTDYSVAILDFNIVLTGYDVARMNIRDILGFGLLPTEDDATGRNDNIWQHLISSSAPFYGDNSGGTPFDDGPYSSHNELLTTTVGYTNLPDPEPAGTYPSLGLDMRCNPFALGPPYSRPAYIASPSNYVDPIPQGTLDIFEGYLKASQTAAKSYVTCATTPSLNGSLYDFPADPWFITREDGPVWLYVTADVVRACNKDLPDGAPTTYFNADRTTTEGVIDDNVLIGDTIWLDSLNRFSEADHAVHLEADPGFQGVATFYERYLVAGTADYREPLPTAWAFRYQYLPEVGINTWVRAFKASTFNRTVLDLASVRSSTTLVANWGQISVPGPATLYASVCIPYTYWAWDEDENVNTVTSEEDPWSGGPAAPIRPVPNLLPLETQEVAIDQFFLVGQGDGDAFGWLLFAWPETNIGSAGLADDYYQTWMGVKYSGFGDYTAAMSGAVMANYNCNVNETVPLFNLGQYSFNPPQGPPTE